MFKKILKYIVFAIAVAIILPFLVNKDDNVQETVSNEVVENNFQTIHDEDICRKKY